MRTTTPYRHIKVEPITGHIGAEISGVDMSGPIAPETFAEIKRAWLENLVVFFRDQNITPASIEALGSRFGQLSITSYTNPVPGFKFAHTLVRAADVPKGENNFGDMWHMDQTVRPIPTMGFLLYSVDCPPYGGDTGFANLYAAYDRLSDGMKEQCEKLVAVHSPSGIYGADGQGGDGKRRFLLAGTDKTYVKITPEEIRAYVAKETEHPLVRVHPETKRKLIMITGYVTRFRGMTVAESRPLIDFLIQHVTHHDYTCRFRWRKGSLALIDNRCMQHIAYQDYAGFRREMLRAEFVGTEPPYGPAKPLTRENSVTA
jgi:taurine dioxygenase